MRERLYLDLGLRIAAAREKANMTQAELAARVDISRPSIANIEQGRQAVPVHKLFQIATALAVSPGDLLPPFESVLGQTGSVALSEHEIGNVDLTFVNRVLNKAQR